MHEPVLAHGRPVEGPGGDGGAAAMHRCDRVPFLVADRLCKIPSSVSHKVDKQMLDYTSEIQSQQVPLRTFFNLVWIDF